MRGDGAGDVFLDVVEKGSQELWQLCRQTPQGHGGLCWTFPTSSFGILAQRAVRSLPALSWVAEPARVKRG